jgi:hypothetical protein
VDKDHRITVDLTLREILDGDLENETVLRMEMRGNYLEVLGRIVAALGGTA